MSGGPKKYYQSEKTFSFEHSKSSSVNPEGKARRIHYDSRRSIPSPQHCHLKNNSLTDLSVLSFSREYQSPAPSIPRSSIKRTNSNSNLSGFSSSVEGSLSNKQIEIYGQVFEDIIKQDTVYGGLLTSVKKNYDEFISQILQQNQDMEEQLNSQKPKNSSTYDKIMEEFNKLKEEIQLKNSIISQLENDKHDIEKKLLTDRSTQEETIKKISSDLKSARVRENKYIKLVSVLKEKGYPVEEIYNAHIRKKTRSEKKPIVVSNKFTALTEDKVDEENEDTID